MGNEHGNREELEDMGFLRKIFKKFSFNGKMYKRHFCSAIYDVSVQTKITQDFVDSPIIGRFFDLLNKGQPIEFYAFQKQMQYLLFNETYQCNVSFQVVNTEIEDNEISLQELTTFIIENWTAGCKKLATEIQNKGIRMPPQMLDTFSMDNQKQIEVRAKQLFHQIKKQRKFIDKDTYINWIRNKKVCALTLRYNDVQVNMPLSFMHL